MSTTASQHVRIRAGNLKAIRDLDWSPTGVCALVGPNGSGKSTALRVVEALRQMLERGFDFGTQGFGPGPLRHLDASQSESVMFAIERQSAKWEIAIGSRGPIEIATSDGAVLTRMAGRETVLVENRAKTTGLPSAKGESMLAALGRAPAEAPLLSDLAGFIARSRFFGRPQLEQLRDQGSAIGSDLVLDADSKNLFTVLRNWRDTSEAQHQSEFVFARMREFFPREFRHLDFQSLGQRTSGALVTPKWGSTKLLPTDWSEGFFTVLARLVALVSVGRDGLVAIDEPENSLHPGLICQLIDAMRMWARLQGVTVVLATHSPVVLDQFKGEPEKVFVMQPGQSRLPVPLDQLKKREWLEHFSIGDIYSHLEVGAPIP